MNHIPLSETFARMRSLPQNLNAAIVEQELFPLCNCLRMVILASGFYHAVYQYPSQDWNHESRG